MDWQRPDAQAQANRVMRQILVEYVSRYRDAGTVASMRYADRNEVVDVGREFASLVEADVETWQHFRDLRRHLLHYPMGHTPEMTDILYWSKERVSRRLVVSVTHLAISRTNARPVGLRNCVKADLRDPLLRCLAWVDRSCARSVCIVARHVPGGT